MHMISGTRGASSGRFFVVDTALHSEDVATFVRDAFMRKANLNVLIVSEVDGEVWGRSGKAF